MNKTFAYHKPSKEGIDKIAELRKAFSDLQDLVSKHCTHSREHEIASLYIEDAAMWAIKGVVVNDPLSVVDPDATFGAGPVLPVVPEAVVVVPPEGTAIVVTDPPKE